MAKDKKYYKDLDTIRNISCIAVLLYHLGLLKGGFLAVCTFFVLTGYLSCISLFNKKDVKITTYYIQRIKHIYMPLLIVTFITVGAISLLPKINFFNMKPETTSIIFGYNNFWQLKANLDYFARHVNSPFMHFWYIGILLQFELVFPIIFKLLTGLGDKTKKVVPCILLGLLTIVSSAYFIYASYKLPIMTVYYGTFTRIFSILFGMFIAFIHNYYNIDIINRLKDKRISKIIFYLYIVILIAAFIFIDSTSKYFAIAMLLTTIISCRLISYGTLDTKKRKGILQKIHKSFAGISYEIYLFQYPILFISQYLIPESIFKIPVIIITTILLSYILHYALSNKKQLIRIVLLLLITTSSVFGLYKYIIAKDYTNEMKQLETKLAENQKLMQRKQEEYANNLKEEEEKWNNVLDDLNNGEEQLGDIVHNLPIVGVGDSVMLGALTGLYNQFPNGYFDAKVSRTDYEANRILLGFRDSGVFGDPVIFNLGTNGQCGSRCRNEILQTCEGRKIFWINVTNDADVHVNASLEAFANENSNVYLVDWNTASQGHPEYFVADGIHLTSSGRVAYSQLIYDTVYQVYLDEYNAKKEQLLNDFENEKNKKVRIYGNTTLLNAYDTIQNDFIDYQLDLQVEGRTEVFDENQKLYPKNIIYIIDNSYELTDEDYIQLEKYSTISNIYIINMIENDKVNPDYINTIDFYKDIYNNPDYLRPDRVYLSDTGLKALSNIILEKIKTS